MKLYFESNEKEHWRNYLEEEAIDLAKKGWLAFEICQALVKRHGLDEDTAYDIAYDAVDYVKSY